MALYFFDVIDNGRLIKDTEGSNLNGLQDGRIEAIAILPDLTKGLRFDGNHHTFIVTARDAMGESVFRAELSFNCIWLE